MGGVAFDFAGELAFLEVLDEFEQVDLVDAFSGQQFFLINDAVCILDNSQL